MIMEYAWSQIEPATAILCACIVTYRPLFHNFHINLSKLSGILSYGRHDSTSTGGDWADMSNNPRDVLRCPVHQDFISDLESLTTAVKPSQVQGCSCPERQVERRAHEFCTP
jgi:hypothetical protein